MFTGWLVGCLVCFTARQPFLCECQFDLYDLQLYTVQKVSSQLFQLDKDLIIALSMFWEPMY